MNYFRLFLKFVTAKNRIIFYTACINNKSCCTHVIYLVRCRRKYYTDQSHCILLTHYFFYLAERAALWTLPLAVQWVTMHAIVAWPKGVVVLRLIVNRFLNKSLHATKVVPHRRRRPAHGRARWDLWIFDSRPHNITLQANNSLQQLTFTANWLYQSINQSIIQSVSAAATFVFFPGLICGWSL